MNQQVDALVHGAPVHSSIDKTQGDGRGVTHLGVMGAFNLAIIHLL
jgi:hypothetical protein